MAVYARMCTHIGIESRTADASCFDSVVEPHLSRLNVGTERRQACLFRVDILFAPIVRDISAETDSRSKTTKLRGAESYGFYVCLLTGGSAATSYRYPTSSPPNFPEPPGPQESGCRPSIRSIQPS